MPAEDLKNLNIEQEKQDEIAHWLAHEIEQTESARRDLEEIWIEIENVYEENELEEKKDFPFEGAAHLMIQLVPMLCEMMKAKVYNTIFAPSDPFTPILHRKELAPFVKPLRRFLTWASDNELKLEDRLEPIILELYKLGNAVAKVVYTRKVTTRHEWDERLREYTPKSFTEKDHPEILHPQLADFFFPLHIHELDDAEWLAERYGIGRNEFARWKLDPNKMNTDRIEHWVEREETKYEKDVTEVARAQDLAEYRFHEVWFEYQLEDGKEPVKLMGTLHLPSHTFVELKYNWFPLAMHPYEMIGHETRPHRIYATGVGKVGTPTQLEVSTMHNQRLDAQTIANAPVFKRKADSLVPEDLVWRAGSVIPVDDPNDIDVLFSGQRFDSTLQEEQHTIQLLRERVGINEFTPEGLSSAQSTTALAILGESTRRFDLTIKNIRRFLGRLMMKVLLLYQKYYPEGKAIMVQGEEGMLTEMVIRFPEEWIAMGMGIEVTATTSATSKELDRQNKLSLFGMITQTYGQISQYLLQAANPQLPPHIQQILLQFSASLLTYLEDVLDDFNLNNARELAGMVGQLQAQIAGLQGPGNQLPGGNPAGAGVGGVPGGPGASGPGTQ